MTRRVNSNADQHLDRGRTAFQTGDLTAAETHIRAARDAGGGDAEVLGYLGYFARLRGEYDEAADHYAAALEQAPGDATLYNNLADARRSQGRNAEAVALFRRAMALAPDRAEIGANLGGLLLTMRHPEAALPVLEQALALNPEQTGAHADIASVLCAMNRYPEAIEHYRAIYRLQPSNNDARYLEALASLALGDFANGWRRHEARWYATLGRDHRRVFDVPAWLGEDNLPGRTILLHAEQGHGDTCQFIRYVPLVIARGARVLLEVQSGLKPLFSGMDGVAGVFGRGDRLPPFDLQCSLMSLPRAFRTDRNTIPATVPYIAPDPDRVAQWRQRLGPPDGRRRIAIAWSGSDTVWNRSMPLAVLAPLLEREDCVFHVAQTELRTEDRETSDGMSRLVDHSRDLADFADTAALLALMDQVVTVDTVLAHLAGAMARPTWTLLPLGADYRWMTHGATSPWYPTMRLFRQLALHDWTSVVASVVQALDDGTTGEAA